MFTSGVSGTGSTKTLYVTGKQNQFHNVLFEQPQAVNTALTACKVAGPSNLFKNVGFLGMTVSQTATVLTTSSSLEIASGAQYCRFEDCTIGSPYWLARTGITGQILFSNTATAGVDPGDIVFKGCRVLDNSVTAGVPAILTKGTYSVDRVVEFRDCSFYNFANNLSQILTQVILDNTTTTHTFLLTGTTAQYGWGKWTSRVANCFIGMPTSSGTGGTALVAT